MKQIVPAALLLSFLAQAQETNAHYPSMASLDRYLIADRNAEITLAKSAAPKSISDNADVMVLERQGYKTAAKGTNGFVCMVERSWTAPFGNPESWNPKIRGPICFNRRPRERTSPSPSPEPSWPWLESRKPRCATRSTPLSTNGSCLRSKQALCATCSRSGATWEIRPGISIRT